MEAKLRIFAVLAAAGVVATAGAAWGMDLRVMSFNVRVGSANDGVDSWNPNRKGLVIDTIEAFGPDVFGVQEALGYQKDYIENNLGGYDVVGRSVNGNGTSEYVAVYYKTSRFTKVDSGTIFLNPTNTPGVEGWDAKLPRAATWVELKDKQNPGLDFIFMNTHWDHVGDEARFESANIMRAKLEELAGATKPIVVTGDFNADQGGAAYRRMTGLDNGDAYRDYEDTYRELHSDSGTVGTAHGFDGKAGDGRIDWILQDGFTTVQATIDRVSYSGRYPSDHFPIEAVLRVVPEPGVAGAVVGGVVLMGQRRRLRRSEDRG